MSKVLLAVTSANVPFYENGDKTGVFYSEVLHPLKEFEAAGYKVDLVSETGTTGFDKHSIEPPFLDGEELKNFESYNDGGARKAVESSVKKASDVKASDYKIFFAAGGHGAIIDFPGAKDLHKLAADIYANGGVVAAVCHGPAIFENLNTADGTPLIKGKTVTGFTDAGEVAVGLDSVIKKGKWNTVKHVAEKEGATYVAKGDWDDYAIESDRIVTGTNPQSASSTARLAIKTAA